MPRPISSQYDERRQQILDAALEVFATRGFSGATNQAIAKAAGINSPGLIYHYFESKEDLLRSVIESHAPPMQLLAQADALMPLPPEVGLLQFARGYLGAMEDPKIGACLRVLIGEAMRSQAFLNVMAEVGIPRVWRLMSRYLERKMDEGLLRRTDPDIAARCFIGPLHLHVLARNVMQLAEEANTDPQALVETHVALFLRGMQPEPSEGGPP